MSLLVSSISVKLHDLLHALSNDMNAPNRMAEYNDRSSAAQTVLLLININFLTLQSSHMQILDPQ